MRKLMLLAPVVALALVSANCSGSAFNSPTGPGVDVSDSATEAKGGGGGGKDRRTGRAAIGDLAGCSRHLAFAHLSVCRGAGLR